MKATRSKPCRQRCVLGMRLQHSLSGIFFLTHVYPELSIVTSFNREKKSASKLLKVLAFAKQTFEMKFFLAAADGTSCFESLQKCQKAQELCSWCSALDPSAFDF